MDLNKIKEIQTQQLRVLKQIVELLEQEGIQYFAIGGTALGAIRHQGFIPWDDDIDLAILRPDYDKFLQLQEKLDKNLLLYNFDVSTDYPLFFSKVYDTSLPYFCYSDRKYAVPRNIFIDFFPWDKITQPDLLKSKLEKTDKKFRRLVFKKNGSLLDKCKFYMYKVVYGFKNANDIYEEYNSLIRQHHDTSSETWGNVLFNDVLEHNDIFPLRQEKFEDMTIFVPRNCEKYLELKYGDYMTPPAEEDRVNHSRM